MLSFLSDLQILTLAEESTFCKLEYSEGGGLSGRWWLTHRWRFQQRLNGHLSGILERGFQHTFVRNVVRFFQSLGFGNCVSRTALSDSPGLGWQGQEHILPISAPAILNPVSHPSCEPCGHERTTSKLVSTAPSGPLCGWVTKHRNG